ncbi:MAG: type II toxin-antitoxin system VapC family toxin [Sphingomonadales bacterium]|nr:MAG: type II toxin-antitoxin system VapC family toxin [Sphingomonadales bacterium]
MSFLLDTNVISEGAKLAPDHGVLDWLSSVDEQQLWLSVISLAELRYGVERLDAGRRKLALDQWLSDHLPARFGDRLLPADMGTADHWSRIVARSQSLGRPIGAMDAWLAATAVQHELTLITRNVADFQATGIRLFNPWRKG